jgi:hypothetical protein
VNRDNTVSFQNLSLQIEAVRWRPSLSGCTVTVHQHLDGSISLDAPTTPAGAETAPRCGLASRQNGATDCRRLTKKPDISLATKSGHSNLLRTCKNNPCHFHSVSNNATGPAIVQGPPCRLRAVKISCIAMVYRRVAPLARSPRRPAATIDSSRALETARIFERP